MRTDQRAGSGHGARPRPGPPVRGEELQMSVYVRAADRAGGRPLYDEIIDRARAAGLAGATAIRGLDGFGEAGPAVRRRSAPVLIEITDDAAAVRAFLPVLDGLIGSGLVVLKPVETVRRPAGERMRTAASPL